jgi:hypothetical protein
MKTWERKRASRAMKSFRIEWRRVRTRLLRSLRHFLAGTPRRPPQTQAPRPFKSRM